MTGPRSHLRWLAPLALSAALFALPAAALDRLDFQVATTDKDLSKAVRSASLLLSQQAQGQTNPQDLFAAARDDYGRILNALYAKGHYSAVITIRIDGREAADIPSLEAPTSISQIAVSVDPGPLFRFSQTSIAPVSSETTVSPAFQKGQPAESGVIADAVSTSLLAWRNAGFAKAAVASEDIVADHANATLAATLRLNLGPRLRFGPLAVEGEARMRERRIRKIAGLPEGEVFSQQALDRAATRLRRTGIFSSVTLTEDDQITAPDLLGITANVVEHKPRRYSLGAEIASLDGLALSGYWLHRNLMGGGERLKIEGEITNIGASTNGVDYSLGITLDRPATLSPDTTAGLTLDLSHLDEVDYFADTVEFGLAFTHYFSETLTAHAGLTYKYQRGEDPGGSFEYRNLSLPIGATWDRRDVPANTSRGFYLDAEVKPFLGFGTTDSGGRFTFDGRAYRSIGAPGRLVLAARLQMGAILGADILDTPRDELFFSGGGGTVRGQPYRSLGVPITKAFGPEFLIGGAHFLGASFEVRAKVTDRIGVVGFFDAGSVGADGFFSDFGGWHSGAGLGLRYDTGFGPIRLDIAAPVGGDTGDGVQIYVGLGQSF
ncbi:autotransporter assembly complex family protein [Tabrizicola sp.]|uniref:autotransporter assembly complex protein TamA n=1 Tax=Tabrizicola sp. TaxID=2005166 RepID=UPI00286C50B7|nr:autotransporter assembly complex family protein [Tabrizicola sp.]